MIELVNEMVIEQFLNDFLVSRSEEFGLLVDTFDRISVRLKRPSRKFGDLGYLGNLGIFFQDF